VPQLRFETSLSRQEADFGMICPECHGGRLAQQFKERKGNRVTTLRAGTIRALVGAAICIVTGPPLLLAGINNLGGQAGILWARAVAAGVLLILGAVVCLVVGIVGLYRDLK
jgi:hypothetical protein